MNSAQLSLIIVEGLKPSIPSSLEDGLVPTPALTPSLLIHAPLVTMPGYSTRPGDVFELVIDGSPVPESRVTYAGPDTGDISLRLPPSLSAALADGAHRLSFLVHMKIGDTLASEEVSFQLDRKAPGGTFLPRIELPWSIRQNGLSLATLVALPKQSLSAKIPAYPYMEPGDLIHLVARLQNGTGIVEKTVAAASDDEYTTASFTRHELESLGGNGPADFTYRVEDRAGNMSVTSYPATIKLFLKGAPETLQGVRVPESQNAVITDQAVKPSLTIQVPAMEPGAAAGDVVSLYIGRRLVHQIQITESESQRDPIAEFNVSYDRFWTDFGANLDAISTEFYYMHVRDGVSSLSASSFYLIDLSVPGGRDPNPFTGASEALPVPILRGATGKNDNVITHEDAEIGATIYLVSPDLTGQPNHGFQPGDSITAFIGDNAIGSRIEIANPDDPIEIPVQPADLKANRGSGRLYYTATRNLKTGAAVSAATSPFRDVRIDTTEDLPGAGESISGPIFTLARLREQESGSYALTISEFIDDYTPLRILGYAGMKEGDSITFSYEGFDRYDDGEPLAGTAGSIQHVVRLVDLLPKDDPDPVTGDLVYLDLRFPLAPAKTLAHGHFECSHAIKNAVGTVESQKTNVLVKIRF